MLTKAEMPVASSDHEPSVINSSVYAGGRKVTDVAIEQAGDWSKRPGHVVWIGLFEPSDELLQRVQQQFDLHPLAIEDAGKAHQHPKLEQYGDGIFIVARTAQMVEGRIAFGETHLFVGRGYVISVRHGASVSYAAVRQRCEACPTVLSQGEDYIVYAILDFIVDNYMPVVEKIHAEVEAIEDTVLATTLSQNDIERLYLLRRDLLRLRNAAGPLVEVCNRLEHTELMPIDREMQAALSRRHRSCASRERGDRCVTRSAGLCLRGEPHGRAGTTNCDCTPAGGVGRHLGRTYRHCRYLRDEFRTHARAQVGVRLFPRDQRHSCHLRHAICAIPPQRLAVTVGQPRQSAAIEGDQS